jgi:hypothetical protein
MAKTVINPRRVLPTGAAPTPSSPPLASGADLAALKRDGKVFDSGGTGRKQCPNCGRYVYFQAASCPACSEPFPRRVRGPGGNKPVGIQINSQTLLAFGLVRTYLEAVGSVDNAVLLLDQCGELISLFGSADAAKEAVALLGGAAPGE